MRANLMDQLRFEKFDGSDGRISGVTTLRTLANLKKDAY